MSAQQAALDAALKMVGDAMGMKLEASTQDRLRIAIVEAATWIRMGAHGRALQVLEDAITNIHGISGLPNRTQ